MEIDSSGSDSDTQSVTWVVGDRCKLKWSGDRELYNARIVKFRKESISTFALVRFSGFDSEDDEWVDIKKLQHRQHKQATKQRDDDNDVTIIESPSHQEANTSFFCPLEGNEEKQRIEDKFKYLEEEDSSQASSGSEKRWQTTKRRLVMPDLTSPKGKSPRGRGKKTLDIQSHKQSDKKPMKSSRNTSTVAKPHIASPSSSKTIIDTLPLSEDESSSDEAQRKPGFTSEELEKPNFAKVEARCPKEPFLLSKPGSKPEIQIPGTINRYLRDYQREGVQFLYQLFSTDHGGMLADDMGLGKTVQVISCIAALLGRTGTKLDILAQKPSFIRRMSDNAQTLGDLPKRDPFLVIGPASVLYNWLDEFETWGYFRIGKYHKHHKTETVANLKKQKLDVVLTTYETFRDNVDELNRFSWEAVFADECHKIKGLKTEVTQALRKISCSRRFGLTGTPLQNSVQELWSLLDWCNPGCLGDLKEFRARYANVIERGQKHSATKRELAEGRKAQEQLAKHRDRWMLRRLKTIIKDQLPEKNEHVVYCRATDLQVSVYHAVFELEYMEAVLRQGEPCVCDSGKTRGKCCYKRLSNGKTVWAMTMSYMHLLLKAANHIALLLPSHTSNENQRQEAKKICETVFREHKQFISQTKEAAFKTLSDPKFCGKMKVLQGLLSVFKKQKAKVLLFSYSTKLLDILEFYVMSMGYEFRRLDGTTKEQTRVQLVHEFNQDKNIFLFLVSTKAGGVGLNLTGANVVIIYDPNWNPTHDLQAQDRAYRIGQRRDVRVYRLITSGTIEENIYLRQIHKQSLGDVAVATKNAKRLFNTGELFGVKNMFHFRTGDRCLTEDILQRHTKIVEGLKTHKTAKEDHLDGFAVDKYVPPQTSDQDGSDKEMCEDEENVVEEERPESEDVHVSSSTHKPNADETDFGLGYVCTQLMDVDFSDDDNEQQMTSRDETVILDQKDTSSRMDSHQRATETFPQDSTEILESKSINQAILDNVAKKKPPTRKKVEITEVGNQRKDKSDGTMDDFLDDLLDFRSPGTKCEKSEPQKIERTRTTPQLPGKELRKPVGKASQKSFDLFDEFEQMGCSDSESDGNGGAKKNNEFLDHIWEEMESVRGNDGCVESRTRKPPTRCSKTETPKSFLKKTESEVNKSVPKGGPYKSKRQLEITIVKAKNLSPGTPSKTRSTTPVKEKDNILKQSKGIPSPTRKGGPYKGKKDAEDLPSEADISLFTGGGTMECDLMDSDDEAATARKRKRNQHRAKKTVKISESHNQIHERDVKLNDEDNPGKLDHRDSQQYEMGTYASVSDVFADCDVVHMHQNRRVTGTSRAEDHMTRCALQDVYERGCDSQAPAQYCQPRDQSGQSTDDSYDEAPAMKKRVAKKKSMKQTNAKKGAKSTKRGSKSAAEKKKAEAGYFRGPRSVVMGKRKVLIGQTPKGVRREHFQGLAEFVKKTDDAFPSMDQVEFATRILTSSRKHHLRWMEGYYGNMLPDLQEAITTETKT